MRERNRRKHLLLRQEQRGDFREDFVLGRGGVLLGKKTGDGVTGGSSTRALSKADEKRRGYVLRWRREDSLVDRAFGYAP